MRVIKRAGWQLMISLFTWSMHTLMVIVCIAAFILSPLAQLALWMRLRRQPRKG